MRVRDLLNQVMRSKQSQQACDTSGAAALFFRCRGITDEQLGLQVPISEAVDAELSPADGAEESRVLLGPGAQGTDAFVLVSRRFADIAYQLAQWN
jgi:hypothetical protein